MQFLAIVKTFVSLFPLIVQAITIAEQAFPQKGQGASKLELVKITLLGAAEVSYDLDAGRFNEIWPSIQKIIAAYVGAANATGTFQK